MKLRNRRAVAFGACALLFCLWACEQQTSPQTYTVTYHATEGRFAENTVDTVTRLSSEIPPKVMREGYNLKGWTEDVYPSDTSKLFNVNAGFSKDTDLYAVWEPGKPKAEWLVLMYVDGDNNLQKFLWSDVNEAEQGLAENSWSNNIRVVVLWDGGGESDPGGEDSRLLELGPDRSASALGQETVDLSSTAEWLANSEVNMGNKETLAAFISWALDRYDASNVILQIGNHGGGPRTIVDTPRAMCWDDSSNAFLSTKAAGEAMAEGLAGSAHEKLDLLLLDVCLGAAVEEAYQYKDSVSYFVASPDSIDGPGQNYTKLISGIKADSTPASVGKKLVTDFKADYAGGSSMKTLTCLDLTKMDDLYVAIDSFAESLLLGDSMKALFDSTLKYNGTFTYLHDIGIFSQNVKGYASASADQKNAADTVITALKSAIVYSWGGGNPSYEGAGEYRGVTICGQDMPSDTPKNNTFYSTANLAFAGSQWAGVLAAWYGAASPTP
jgi:hypothetical protein